MRLILQALETASSLAEEWGRLCTVFESCTKAIP